MQAMRPTTLIMSGYFLIAITLIMSGYFLIAITDKLDKEHVFRPLHFPKTILYIHKSYRAWIS